MFKKLCFLGSMDYYFHRITPLGPFEVSKGQTIINENVSVGQLPLYVLATFISSSSANGAWDRNIYRFHHMRMNNTYMTFETQKFPAVEFKPKFPDSIVDREIDVTRMYRMFLRGKCKHTTNKMIFMYTFWFLVLGMEGKNDSNGVSMMDWIYDNTVICFDMSTNDIEQPTSREPSQPGKGYLRYFASLNIPPTENYQLWLFPVYASTMSISPENVVSLDFTPSAAS